MQHSFWHSKWQTNDIAFHCGQPNPALEANFQALQLPAGSRILVPLCGKTLDIHWLRAQGCRVVGVELSEIAIEQLFQELGVKPERSRVGAFELFQAEGLDVFDGDLFEPTQNLIGHVDAVYDRAAMVALPSDMRKNYAANMIAISNLAPQLLITYDYDQLQIDGPPFSVPEKEIQQHYANSYQISLLKSIVLPEKLKGRCEAKETIWLLRNKKF